MVHKKSHSQGTVLQNLFYEYIHTHTLGGCGNAVFYLQVNSLDQVHNLYRNSIT